MTSRRSTATEMPRPWKSQNDFHRRLEIVRATTHAPTQHPGRTIPTFPQPPLVYAKEAKNPDMAPATCGRSRR